MKVRIEIHLEPDEAILLDELAKTVNRNRKNYCETEIKKLITAFKDTKGRK